MASPTPPSSANPLTLLSVVIPARNEEGCLGSTIEHLHLELRLHNIPHEIVVVDDGSTDGTWEVLTRLEARLPELVPVKNKGQHGFGRAVICGLDRMKGPVRNSRIDAGRCRPNHPPSGASTAHSG